MRIVRVQVYARERYKAASGMYDIRSITLEADIESSDGDTQAIWDLQRQADRALDSWIDLHRPEASPVELVEPPPIEVPF
jgi:hypothetical protein